MAASIDLFWAIIPILLNIDAHSQRLSLGFWGRPIIIWHWNFRRHIEFQDGRHHKSIAVHISGNIDNRHRIPVSLPRFFGSTNQMTPLNFSLNGRHIEFQDGRLYMLIMAHISNAIRHRCSQPTSIPRYLGSTNQTVPLDFLPDGRHIEFQDGRQYLPILDHISYTIECRCSQPTSIPRF